jgi:hypothetical protein
MSDNQQQQSGKKRGPVAGAKYNPEKKTMKDWYILCKTFEERPNKAVGVKEFLVSNASGSKFSGTRSESSSFIYIRISPKSNSRLWYCFYSSNDSTYALYKVVTLIRVVRSWSLPPNNFIKC